MRVRAGSIVFLPIPSLSTLAGPGRVSALLLVGIFSVLGAMAYVRANPTSLPI